MKTAGARAIKVMRGVDSLRIPRRPDEEEGLTDDGEEGSDDEEGILEVIIEG